MAQINIWICEGILVRDCEVKPIANGGTFCMFLLMNNPYSKAIEKPSEIVEVAKSTCIPCRCFDKDLNKILEKYGKKGVKLTVVGKARMNPSFVDEKGDVRPASLYMYVEELHLTERQMIND